MWVRGGVGTKVPRTRTHARSFFWAITHTKARTQDADFYPTHCGYPPDMIQIVIPKSKLL
jgi:hypothetical protein